MNKIKDTIRKIAPFVKNYRKGFIFAIILIPFRIRAEAFIFLGIYVKEFAFFRILKFFSKSPFILPKNMLL